MKDSGSIGREQGKFPHTWAGARGSRRRLLLGGATVIGSGSLATVAVSGSASAATGGSLLLGESNTATSRTLLDTTTQAGLIGLQCNATGEGSIGLYGSTEGGIGVQGTDDGASVSEAGEGVYGTSTFGDGVKAVGGRNGVWAIGGDAGAGLLAQNAGDGPALQVDGIAAFARSGIATVPARSKTTSVTGVALSPQSIVLATIQNPITGVWLECAVPDVESQSFEIVLSRPVPERKVASVGWFIVN